MGAGFQQWLSNVEAARSGISPQMHLLQQQVAQSQAGPQMAGNSLLMQLYGDPQSRDFAARRMLGIPMSLPEMLGLGIPGAISGGPGYQDVSGGVPAGGGAPLVAGMPGTGTIAGAPFNVRQYLESVAGQGATATLNPKTGWSFNFGYPPAPVPVPYGSSLGPTIAGRPTLVGAPQTPFGLAVGPGNLGGGAGSLNAPGAGQPATPNAGGRDAKTIARRLNAFEAQTKVDPSLVGKVESTRSLLDVSNDLDQMLQGKTQDPATGEWRPDPAMAAAVARLGPTINLQVPGMRQSIGPAYNTMWSNYSSHGGAGNSPAENALMERIGYLHGAGWQQLAASSRNPNLIKEIQKHIPSALSTPELARGQNQFIRQNYGQILSYIPAGSGGGWMGGAPFAAGQPGGDGTTTDQSLLTPQGIGAAQGTTIPPGWQPGQNPATLQPSAPAPPKKLRGKGSPNQPAAIPLEEWFKRTIPQ